MRTLILFVFLLIFALSAQAQIVNPGNVPVDSSRLEPRQLSTEDKEFANPSVLGMGPSKGVIFRYERAPDFGITSKSGIIGDSHAQVQKLNELSLKVYAPVWNRPHFKVVVGFNYVKQQFNMERRDTITYPLYKVIDDRNLNTIGSQLVVLRPVDGRRYWLARIKAELNGDYRDDIRRLPIRKYLRTSAEAFYGWKRSARESVAVGAQFGYTFGRRSIYPAVIWNKTWSDHWGFEALLPAKVRVRYNANERTLFYGGYEVQGDSYTINIQPALGGNRTVELRRTDIAAKLRVERELLSFLWIGAEAGYRYYASFNTFDSSSDRNQLISSTLRNSAMANVELFLTPPRKRLLKQ